MFCRPALTVTLSLFALSLVSWDAGASASAQAKPAKPAKLAVKKVRQRDGSVIVRLALQSRAAAPADPQAVGAPAAEMRNSPLARQAQFMEQWQEAVTEPRVMTALGTVANEAGVDARALHRTLNPASVRNWAEFMDADLYLRWQSSNLNPRFNPAILHATQDAWTQPRGVAFPIRFPVPAEFQAGAPLKPSIWSNAFGSGPGGREAAQAWLKLPLPDAAANPWLRSGQNYRY